LIDSTRITSVIADSKKAMKYYSIFLNLKAAIASGHNARIIKNVGDSLIYYIPETSEITKLPGFKAVLESAITMILSHDIINTKLAEEKLPPVDYRIKADYGKVQIAKSISSKSEDLVGATINICSKINLKACPNGLVIGSGLYRMLKSSFSEETASYSFKEIGEYSSRLSKSYPV
jgi:two-component system, OmpR family, response regulator ChvI